ncbi:hypothetical protein SAMN02745130_01852 [Thiothrix eikelboomii]|uniref:Uncharacterized protein n=1 Tax=Thiothrix eikelboomii TaxID=92487 RepID=A0A1T4WLU0_9GAMM|nr:hypothetical protein [Thiothrix eikelboomii]SKA78294.1 hypothetical protein SAMN02745130_01852 [Thiothrix eikelboomii]
MFKRFIPTVALILSAAGFVFLPAQLAARPAPPPASAYLVKIYKSQGSLQCQGGGESVSQMRRQLIKVGVKVKKANCGVDGMMYPAVCGAPDGKINIFTITRDGLAKVQAQGFGLLKNLPDAQLTECKL